ncbi:MAG: hypothetical protein P8099_17205, partial [Gemmatimonadota bacterium]
MSKVSPSSVVLLVGVVGDALALAHVVQGDARELAVAVERGDVEVDGAVVGDVAVAALHEAAHQIDHVIDVVCGPGKRVGGPNAQGVQLFQERVDVRLCELGDADALFAGVVDDLVIDVREVHDEPDVVAQPLQVAVEQVVEEERAIVAD